MFTHKNNTHKKSIFYAETLFLKQPTVPYIFVFFFSNCLRLVMLLKLSMCRPTNILFTFCLLKCIICFTLFISFAVRIQNYYDNREKKSRIYIIFVKIYILRSFVPNLVLQCSEKMQIKSKLTIFPCFLLSETRKHSSLQFFFQCNR